MRGLVGLAAAMGVLGLGVWLTAGPARAVPPSSEAGADIAARWCAGCHVVDATGSGSDAARSFLWIANNRDAKALTAFLANPHAKPMRGFALSKPEIDDVVAYIGTLADNPRQ